MERGRSCLHNCPLYEPRDRNLSRMRSKHLIMFFMPLFMVGCAAIQNEKEGSHFVATRHANGKTRTKYLFKENGMNLNLTLWDSTGTLQLNQDVCQNMVGLNYMRCDTCDSAKKDLKKLTSEISPLINKMAEGIWRTDSKKSKKGVATFFIWINSNGIVEHAIYQEYRGLTKEGLLRALNEIESWSFSGGIAGRGLVVEQRVNFIR